MEQNSDSRQVEIYGDRRTGGDRIPEVLSPIVNRIPSPIAPRNMMRRQADTGLNLVTILTLVMKRKLLIAGLFALFFVPVVAYVVTAPPKYEAEVKLILKKNRSETPVAGAAQAPTGVGEAEVAGEIELLKGHELYEHVALQAGLAKPGAENRRAMAEAVRQ